MVTQTLVQVLQNSDDTRDDDGTEFSEPAFGLSNSRALQIDAAAWGARAQDHFAHLIATNPADLLAHVQRINLCVAQSDANAVYGALLDLFLVLGTKGGALRKRMYEAAARRLENETRNLLADSLVSGLAVTDVLPISSASVLSRGLRGTTELVESAVAAGVGIRDPLEEANECLEYGQIDAARRILEAAVLDQPDREELHNDLLEIYQKTGDLESFLEMHGKLAARHNPLADVWELMAASFGAGDSS